jgi:purine nucleosidase
MPASTNNHTTVRFLELSETVARNIVPQDDNKSLLLPLLQNIQKEATTAGYKIGNNNNNNVVFAHFRYEELLQVGCSVESPVLSITTSESDTAKSTLVYNKFAANTVRCAHQRFSSPSSSDDFLNQQQQQQQDQTVVASHTFQRVFNKSFSEFVGKFKQRFDPELIPDGSFYVVFPVSANFTVAEFYCVLANEPEPIPVILDHDGGVDDLVALMLLASATVKPLTGMARRVQLLGTTILDADCFASPTGVLCRRLFCMFEKVSETIPKLPVGVSPLQGTAFPFPNEWRKDCLAMVDFPCLHTDGVNAAMEKREEEPDGNGHELLAKLVMESPRPVTIVVTGPLTNVAYCLKKYGEKFANNVRELSIMGGAVHVSGNVINADLPKTAHKLDGSAEWNIYWDAPAAKEVLESPLIRHKLLYSLDATNHVPVSSEFVRRFGRVSSSKNPAVTPSLLATFTGNSWAMCTWLAFMLGGERGYFAWDVLCAMGILVPTISQYDETRIEVDADSKSPSEGRTIPVASSKMSSGQIVQVASKIDAQAFYRLVLESAALF